MDQGYIHPVIRKAPTVNYHMLRACNMSCGFCFATFKDIPLKHELGRTESLELVAMLGRAGFRKINFAGGEPTLRPWLPDLVQMAKSHGMTTSIVTNGTRISPESLDNLASFIDIIALSIDSVNLETQRKIGRVEKGKGKVPIDAKRYIALSKMIRARGIRLKVNTVVNRANHAEDFRSFVTAMRPERWKIFQALPVLGQNDHAIDQFTVTDSQFEKYVERNRNVEGNRIVVVPECNDLMTGSYAMIDPLGRFFDNTKGRHSYGKPILEVGVITALESVVVDTGRFEARGGSY